MTATAAVTEPRWFWWSADQLGSPWCLLLWGGDEWGRRDLGIRMPGGMLFLALWRFADFRGPCVRCGLWEHVAAWSGTHCQPCAGELADRARGCWCPSILDDTLTLDGWLEAWPARDCPVHDPPAEVTA